MDSDFERAKRAIIFIAENADRQPTLTDVAAHVGLSPHHFQRLFARWAGVSPKRFLQHLTAARAKVLLRESRTVLDTAFAVGLSSTSRLHDLLVTTEAVTPGEFASFGDGVRLRYGIHETPFGGCLIAATDRGVCALRFVDEGTADVALDELHREWINASLIRESTLTADLAARIFERQVVPGDPLHVLLRGTNFQLRVWEGLLRVPEGCLVSYGDLARRIGVPRASRAVASAVGANPVAYLIPCHRVLRSSGALGGYRWGIDRKLVMLERELV